MSNKKEPYLINIGISAALTTGRAELLKLVDVEQLGSGDIKEILRLLGDLIEERQARKQKDYQDKYIVKEALRTIRAHADKLEDIFNPVDADDEDG